MVQEDGGGGALRVVATTSVLGDVVAQVVGDDVAVETLMPPGADPHSFEPSARQIESLQGATLVVANGAGFEEGLLDLLEGAEGDGVAVFQAGDHVDLLAFGEEGEHAEHEGEEDAHADGGEDPHFFQDPSRMAAAVRALGPALAEAGLRALRRSGNCALRPTRRSSMPSTPRSPACCPPSPTTGAAW